MYFIIFSKGDNFCDYMYLFASLDNETLPKRKKNFLIQEQTVLKLDTHCEERQNKNDRVESLEGVHANISISLFSLFSVLHCIILKSEGS